MCVLSVAPVFCCKYVCVVGLFYGSPLMHLGTFLLLRCKCPCCLWRPPSVACWFVLWVSFHEVKFLLLWRCNCSYYVWCASAVACWYVFECLFSCSEVPFAMALQVFVLCVFCCMLVCLCASLFMHLGPFCYEVASVRIVCGAHEFVWGSFEAVFCGFLLWVLLHVYRHVMCGSLYTLRDLLFVGLFICSFVYVFCASLCMLI